MDLKALYQRFRSWQTDPFARKRNPAMKTHQCAGCGHTYEGIYCPVCGQRYDEGKVDWHTIWKDLVSIFGLDKPNSFLAFFAQLFARPGYMIGDYISGRQKMYSSPIGMLGIVAGVTVLVRTNGQDPESAWLLSLADGGGIVGAVLTWLSGHLNWAILIQAALLIIPTWMLFRHSPRHNRHTWPQGIYIQVFMASLVLICIMLRDLVGDWILVLVPVFYYIAYRQLFGYSVWGTLWRTVLALGVTLYTIAVSMMGVLCLSGKYTTDYSTGALVAIGSGLLALGLGILYLGYRIDKKKAKA
jgi:hypothetical protein